jgi:hypothetical protein
MLKLKNFLDSGLTDGGEFVSLTRRPPFTPMKVPGTHFRYTLNLVQGSSGVEGLGELKNPMNLSGIEPATFLLVLSYATVCSRLHNATGKCTPR